MPNPLASPLPDWRQFSVDGIPFWLPPRFEGGEFGPAMDETLRRIAALGGNCIWASEQFRLLDRSDFLAVDADRCSGGALTSLGLNQEEIAEGISVRAHIEEGVVLLPQGFQPREWEDLPFDEREGGRIVVDYPAGGFKLVSYSMREGGRIWTFQLTASVSDDDSALLEIERIALIFEAALPDE